MTPAQFGSAFATGAASASLQQKLRKMSRHPEDPRVFSQAKLLLAIGIPTSILGTFIMYFPISEYMRGETDDIFSIIVPASFISMAYVFVAHGLFRRFGVDRDKIWTRFGKVFYREVRFDQLDRLSVGVHRYKLYSRGTLVNLDYNRFDYSLAYIRLLEELQYRRFQLRNIEIDDPAWEDEAQGFRNALSTRLYRNHRAFYDANPAELDRLKTLAQPPASYVN